MRGPLAAFGGACALSLSLTAPVVGDAPALAPATTSPPTVTINQAAFQADPTTASLIYFTVKFSKPVTGFTAGDVSLAGSTATGDLTAFVSGSGASYSVWVAGMTGPGRVIPATQTL